MRTREEINKDVDDTIESHKTEDGRVPSDYSTALRIIAALEVLLDIRELLQASQSPHEKTE